MALPSPIFGKQEEEKPVKQEKKIYQPQFHHKREEFTSPKQQFRARKPFTFQKKKSWDFPCNYCNVGYDTRDELFAHRRTHEKCAFETCNFNASSGEMSFKVCWVFWGFRDD